MLGWSGTGLPAGPALPATLVGRSPPARPINAGKEVVFPQPEDFAQMSKTWSVWPTADFSGFLPGFCGIAGLGCQARPRTVMAQPDMGTIRNFNEQNSHKTTILSHLTELSLERS